MEPVEVFAAMQQIICCPLDHAGSVFFIVLLCSTMFCSTCILSTLCLSSGGFRVGAAMMAGHAKRSPPIREGTASINLERLGTLVPPGKRLADPARLCGCESTKWILTQVG